SSVQNSSNKGGYSLSVVDTATMKLVSQINTAGTSFIGLVVTGNGPYTLWASGGADQKLKSFAISTAGQISAGLTITIPPITPLNQGFVSNYTPDAKFSASASPILPIPTGFSRPTTTSPGGAKTTFPAGLAFSPDKRYLYVACNGDSSLAVIDTQASGGPKVVQQLPVGFFPYGVSVGSGRVLVSNWGISEYKFSKPAYDANGILTGLDRIDGNQPDGFYVPVTDTNGINPRTSSITVLNGAGANLALTGAIYQGHALDELFNVGDTHPSATAIVKRGDKEVLYVTKSNSDAIGLIRLGNKVQKL